jgi:hypothetical protein
LVGEWTGNFFFEPFLFELHRRRIPKFPILIKNSWNGCRFPYLRESVLGGKQGERGRWEGE